MTEQNLDTLTEDTQESAEAPQEPQDAPDAPEHTRTPEDASEEPETFPADYVKRLRKEAADARVKAKKTNDLARRLHTALVTATGRLADPSDLPFDETHLDNEERMNEAIERLLASKPHLASRRPRGDIGQGRTSTSNTVDLAALLRARA